MRKVSYSSTNITIPVPSTTCYDLSIVPIPPTSASSLPVDECCMSAYPGFPYPCRTLSSDHISKAERGTMRFSSMLASLKRPHSLLETLSDDEDSDSHEACRVSRRHGLSGPKMGSS